MGSIIPVLWIITNLSSHVCIYLYICVLVNWYLRYIMYHTIDQQVLGSKPAYKSAIITLLDPGSGIFWQV